MSFVGVARGRNGDLVIFNPQKLPDLFTMQPHKQMHHHKQGGGVWAAKTTTTTRNTGLRLQLICAIISLPTSLIMVIKQSKLLFILGSSTIEETLHLPYSVQLRLSSTKSRLEIQYVSDLTSIRHNRSQMDSTVKSTAKALLQHTSQFKVNPEFTINLILVLIVTF